MSAINAARWLLAPTRRKWVLAAITVVILIASVVSCGITRQNAQNARVEAEEAKSGVRVLERARGADNAAVGAREASRSVIRIEEVQNRVETERALEAHPEWSSVPVPHDILGSLRE